MIGLLLTVGLCTTDAPPRYVAERAAVLSASTTVPAAQLRDIELWISQDRGDSWRLTAAKRVAPAAVRFDAPQDGEYWAFLRVITQAGDATAAPGPQAAPHAALMIDTAAPTLQIHEVRPASGSNAVRIRATVLDEHLGRGGLRLFVRTDSAAWVDAGAVECIKGEIDWTPALARASISALRLVATDRAGNRALDEWHGSLAGRAEVTQWASSVPTPDEIESTRGIVEANVGGALAPVAPPRGDPFAALDAEARARLEQLRARAREHSDRGQFDLALARLDDALTLAPQAPELLVDSARLARSAGKLDLARRHYDALLSTNAEEPEALEGLGLIALAERNWLDAQQRFEQLTAAAPAESRYWLHLGDASLRLGGVDAARRAWQRAEGAADAATRRSATERLKAVTPR